MRLFIGIKIEPNPEIMEILSAAKKLDLRIMAKENLHINLHFLGDVEPDKLEGIKKALDSVGGSGSFEIDMRNVGAFPNNEFIRVIWIGVVSAQLVGLKEKIDSGLEQLGFNTESSYIPHITLARVPRQTDEARNLLCDKEFGRQTVEEIRLIRSVLGPGGPRYESIYSVRL